VVIIFIQEINNTRSVFRMVPADIKIQSIENIYSVRAVFTYWYMGIYDIPERIHDARHIYKDTKS
jgi:hypothetical protein